jgi:hypothetical protein
MFDFSEVSIERIVVHEIGNRTEEQGVKISQAEISLKGNMVEDALKQYFLSRFKSEFYYSFAHESDLQLNQAYNYTCQVFEDLSMFYDHSVNLAQLLYEKSNHPKIKPGEFYVVHFSNVIVEGEEVDAIGFFKSENKDTFIRVYQHGENFEVEPQDGINIKKLDKGCLIFNIENDRGYKVALVDSSNPSGEAFYWRDEFLGLAPRENEFYQTSQMIDMIRSFSDEVLTPENNIHKDQQVNFVKKTEDYFNNNEAFDTQEFQQNVINNDEISEAFEEYKHQFEDLRAMNPLEQFEISQNALKKNKKYFRSIIKLDKNFHIYVHSNPDFIEKGVDNTKGLKYYKLFFHEES